MPEIRGRDVHRLHQQVGALVRQQLPDEEQERIFEVAIEQVEHLRIGLSPQETERLHHRRDDPYVVVADRLELGGVEARGRDRQHDPVPDRLELQAAQHEQLGERVVDAFEILRGRDVVVHEHDRLGAREQEGRDRRFADRGVIHEQPARAARTELAQRPHLARPSSARCGGRTPRTARPGGAPRGSPARRW